MIPIPIYLLTLVSRIIDVPGVSTCTYSCSTNLKMFSLKKKQYVRASGKFLKYKKTSITLYSISKMYGIFSSENVMVTFSDKEYFFCLLMVLSNSCSILQIYRLKRLIAWSKYYKSNAENHF